MICAPILSGVGRWDKKGGRIAQTTQPLGRRVAASPHAVSARLHALPGAWSFTMELLCPRIELICRRLKPFIDASAVVGEKSIPCVSVLNIDKFNFFPILSRLLK